MAAVQQQVRHEWYQTDQKVVITVFIKNAQNRNCEVNIKPNQVLVIADDLPKVKFDLLHEISQERSTHKIFTVKIEITLFKLDGVRWTSLEKTTENAPTPAAAVAAPAAVVESAAEPVEAPNAARGSSGVAPKNPKDWDKLVKDIWEKEDLEKSESDALNNLFQKIYSDSDPDIQRAMNKSFTESGGTVLSTNWNEVGSGKVEMKPPDGTEYREWEK